jgi:hypothetical protein
MKIGLISLALQLKMNGTFKNVNKIMDMGTKALRVNYEDLEYAFKQTNLTFEAKKFNFLKEFPKGKRRSTKLFWEQLDIKDYSCLDINNEKDSIYCDLNIPFNDKKHLLKYDLVMDFGNNEHAFNVGEAYRTMYNLCNKDGYLWIFQSVFNGNGFFQFDISFFEGMALANQMGIIHASYIVCTNDYDQFLIPANKDLFNMLDLSKVKSIDITYVLKKTNLDDFKYYYQYNLKDNKRYYAVDFLTKNFPPERHYIQTKTIKNIKSLVKKNKANKFTKEWAMATEILKK